MKKKQPPRDAAEKDAKRPARAAPNAAVAGLRVIGGALRHRKIPYGGDPRTRPMKDRTREAIFNLISDVIAGTFVLDLFAGTGALGIEALSRGAERARFCEKHFPTADTIRRALDELGLADRGEVAAGDVFLHLRRLRRDGPPLDASRPWLVFCSPPYDFFVERRDDLLALVDDVLALAPPDSWLIVESDARFDPAALPDAESWRVREYPPAVVAIYRTSAAADPGR